MYKYEKKLFFKKKWPLSIVSLFDMYTWYTIFLFVSFPCLFNHLFSTEKYIKENLLCIFKWPRCFCCHLRIKSSFFLTNFLFFLLENCHGSYWTKRYFIVESISKLNWKGLKEKIIWNLVDRGNQNFRR